MSNLDEIPKSEGSSLRSVHKGIITVRFLAIAHTLRPTAQSIYDEVVQALRYAGMPDEARKHKLVGFAPTVQQSCRGGTNLKKGKEQEDIMMHGNFKIDYFEKARQETLDTLLAALSARLSDLNYPVVKSSGLADLSRWPDDYTQALNDDFGDGDIDTILTHYTDVLENTPNVDVSMIATEWNLLKLQLYKRLTAEQLIQLGWHRDTSLPMRGVKDYAPCGSWMENKAHQVTFRERAELLAEERVAKLGILAKGEWKPAMKKVQLVKNKKKFWQSMGYSEDGKEFFQPEEALFLLDAGVLEIYYGGVPLSVQQAYSTLLHCDLTMEQYQVFALLSRYGFILRRHNPDLRVTEYERKIKLNQFLKSKPKSKKRNRHPLETVMGEDELEQVDVPIKVSKVGDVGVECWAGDSECRTVIGESRKTPPLSSVCGCVEADDTELRAPVRTRTPELPVESPEQTTTSEQPLESPEQTTILEIPAKSPEWTKTPELPVESPERTTTSEQPLESLEQTTIPEIPVGSPEQTTPPNLAVATPELTSTDELTVETSERTTNSKLSLKRTQHTAASELLVEIPERNLICDSPVATPHETKPVTVPKKPDKDELRPTSRVPYSKWDWTKVTLPNIANKSCLVLQKPNPDLLPCCVLYGKDTYTFDLSSFVWSRRPEKMWEFSLGGTSWKRNIQASNWGDYRKQYQKYVSEYSLETSPAGHLWRSDVTPLIKPQDAISTASILQKLQIIESVQLSFPQHISDGGCADRSVSFRVMFDVFLPNTRFKKTAELCPHHHLCIVRSADRLPSMGETLALARHCYPGVPLHFAVVDGGDINFYIFHDIKLPTKLDVK